MIHIKYLPLLVIVSFNYALAQKKNPRIPDSLSSKTFEYFNERVIAEKNDSVKRSIYAQSWLMKAKSSKDFKQMAQAYKVLVYSSKKKLRLPYADSLVAASRQTSDNQLKSTAYITKGAIHYSRKEHMKALDNYLMADSYITNDNDSTNTYKIKYVIALAKYYLGYYKEATVLFKECERYLKGENIRAYLNTLHALSLCYNKSEKYKLSSETNSLGLKKGIELEDTGMAYYFHHSEGINHYALHHYKKAIEQLQNVLPDIIANHDFANEALANFYIGRSYWALQQKEKAVAYFKKVDSAFDKHRYAHPDIREAYELLIRYYEQQDNTTLQLHYVKKLLKIDQVLHSNYKYLSGRIHKEYDTKALLQAKKDIEQSLLINKITGISIISIMTLTIMFMIRRHFRNKKLFEELMKPSPATAIPLIVTSNKETDLDINPELVTVILKNLEKFERNKRYLQKEMTLMRVASILNTNSKYVSKIIAHHRHKKFTEYINDLKTDHIIELLKKENKYRNYTNKALGEEAGFGSTQNFTRAFNNRTGISPTYFISQLNKLKVAEYEKQPS